MKTLNEYILLVSRYFHERAVNYGVKKMGIFGSVARCENNENSDIDIYYEGKADILLRSQMKMELEKILQCPVDIVRKRERQENSDFEIQVNRDIIYV